MAVFKPRPWLTCLAIAFVLSSCTVVRHNQKGLAQAEDSAFDAPSYVEKIWTAQAVPDLEKQAVDLVKVVAALKSDPDGARSKYGHRQEETAPFVFVVKGTVKVAAAHLESGAATLDLALAAPNGDPAALQIGPVIKTSAVRDALSFIHFGDFTNQVDFANLSRALNTKAKDAAAVIDREHAVGVSLNILGAFAEDASGAVLITPVRVEVVR
jgi:predicted lipoprotein